MRSRGVIGKRIVAVRQIPFFNRSTGKMDVDVTAIVLENGWELRPFVTATEDSEIVDLVIYKPKGRKP